MKENRSVWLFGIALILFIIGLYLISSYNNIFDSRTAYLYDPVSDDVFKVELTPYIHEYNKWDPFNPFKSLSYTSSTYAEYLGKLESILTEYQAGMELLRNDIDAWREKSDQRLDRVRQHITDENYTHEFWHIEYYIKSDPDYTDQMPNILSEIFNNDEINENEILLVDATVAKTVIYPNDNFNRNTSIQILQEALLFKGNASYLLYSNGLY